MVERLRDVGLDVPRILLVTLAVVIGTVVVYGALTSGAAFGAFNPSWEGTSDLRTTAESSGSDPVIVENTSRYDAYGEGDVAFVLAPREPYTETEAARIRAFVERGGTLVVADRAGDSAPALLGSVGAEARPYENGTVLRDERSHHRSPALPIAETAADHPLVAGVGSVTLNYGTAVELNNATVLARTSEFAYLDADGSGDLSGDEELTTYPVVTVENVSDGRVVVVGDASVFINAMQDIEDNRAFTTALVDGTNTTLVDISHRESVPPLAAALLALRSSVPLQVGFALWTLAMVGLAARVAGGSVPSPVRPGPGEGEERADERTRGPSILEEPLDRETLRRATEGLLSDRAESRDDE